MKKKYVVVLILIAAIALLAATVSADQRYELTADTSVERMPVPIVQPKGAVGAANYIVQLTDAPLALYQGGVSGLAPTSASATGQAFDLTSPASVAYEAHLIARQDALLNSIAAVLDRSPSVGFQYRYAFNGVVVEMTPEEAAQVATLPGVAKIYRERIEEPATDTGPAFIGAPSIWDGSATGVPTQGEGTVIAVIDTGINFDHPSFADIGGDGYDHPAPIQYFGVCDPGDPLYDPAYATACNDKLIGAYTYVSEAVTPEDSDGHGSHTASTAAGNHVDALLEAPTIDVDLAVSGVAPHAHIIAFDACVAGCPSSALVASVNKIVELNGLHEGLIDVINYSISGGEDPYGDPVELAFLAATETGVFVSASAGNAGTSGSAAHRSPWVTSVGASTHGRTWANQLINMDSSNGPLADIDGRSVSAGYGPAPIVYAGDYSNGDPDPEQCLNPFPPGTWTNGEIVVCDRGTIARVDKGANVLAGGAGGFVLANVDAQGESINADPHYLPAIHIGDSAGDALRAWLANGASDHVATITEGTRTVDPAQADIMAGFSSQGPNNTFDTIIPDVTAPGVDIFAAYEDGTIPPDATADWTFLGGTSMSSPHNAGAGLLMKALYPSWSPSQIQSALMTTAKYTGVLKADGLTPADPFDFGAGRIQVAEAARAGLVLGETIANFEGADGDADAIRQLNIASMANSSCVGGTCVWTRTVEAIEDGAWDASWTGDFPVTIDPASFALTAGETQELTITAQAGGLPADVWAFSNVVLTPQQPVGPNGEGGIYCSTPSVPIPDNDSAGVSDTISIADSGAITDLDVYVNATHSWVGDLVYTLTHGVDNAVIIDRPGVPSSTFGCSGNDYDVTVNDEGVDTPIETQCSNLPAIAGDAPGGDPVGPVLSAFDGADLAGDWTLNVADYAGGDTGTLVEWCVQATTAAGGPPEAHLPVAVVPVFGQINGGEPVAITTRRDAGSWLIPDNTSLEITDLTVDFYGPNPADINAISLSQDPTNGDPYDNLNDGTTFWFHRTVNAGDLWFVAEVLFSEAPDIDMFVGLDTDGDGPEASEELCASTTSSWNEYCDFVSPAAGDYWILIQNWDGSANQPDDVHVASAIVPSSDVGLMSVEGPASVPAGQPFDLRVFWDGTGFINEYDRWYYAFELGTDPGNAGNLGLIPGTLDRVETDVSKSVNNATPAAGETLTYTIEVLPNVTNEEMTYFITDTIPAGLTYVPGSAAANFGTVDVTGDTLTWTGAMVLPGWTYEVATSMTDPACTMPLANSGSYVDLELYGILTNPAIAGDSIWFSSNPSGGEFEFFGELQGEVVNYTDDGFAFFDPSTPGGQPWVYEPIPTAADPNNLMAAMWNDFVVVYDAAENKGVSLANLTSGGVPAAFIIEWDDVEPWPGSDTDHFDFQVLLRYEAGPDYEYVFAYDNLVGDVTNGTIGLENALGSAGVQYAYDDIAVTDGMAVCFDQVEAGAEVATITYQVTVDTCGETLTNQVVHDTDNPGSMPVALGVDVTAAACAEPGLNLTKTVSTDASCGTESAIEVEAGTEVTYCYTAENTGNVVLPIHDLSDDQLGDILTGFAFDLEVGASVSVTATAVITEDTVNVATWTATEVTGAPLAEDTATATVTVAEPTDVSLVDFDAETGTTALPLVLAIIVGVALAAFVWLRKRALN